MAEGEINIDNIIQRLLEGELATVNPGSCSRPCGRPPGPPGPLLQGGACRKWGQMVRLVRHHWRWRVFLLGELSVWSK